MIIIIGDAEGQVGCGNPQQAELIRGALDLGMPEYRPVGEEFEVIFDFATIPPCEGVEPQEDDSQFRQQDIQGVAAADMDFLMDEDLLEGIMVVQRGVDKYGIRERAGTAVVAGLNDTVAAVADDGAGKGAGGKGDELKRTLCTAKPE